MRKIYKYLYCHQCVGLGSFTCFEDLGDCAILAKDGGMYICQCYLVARQKFAIAFYDVNDLEILCAFVLFKGKMNTLNKHTIHCLVYF